MNKKMKEIENQIYLKGFKNIAGLDEVGRGCIAGPLVVACVILSPSYINNEINDSKLIKSHLKRKELAEAIKKEAIDYHIEFISPEIVDKMNPKNASRFGMEQCLKKIKTKPDFILIDFEQINTNGVESLSVVKGDQKSQTIAAASILAKVARDEYMISLSKQYHNFSFDKHVGYLTNQHLKEIQTYGPIKSVHRFSYKPIKK